MKMVANKTNVDYNFQTHVICVILEEHIFVNHTYYDFYFIFQPLLEKKNHNFKTLKNGIILDSIGSKHLDHLIHV